MKRIPNTSYPLGDSAVFRLQSVVKLTCFVLILSSAIAADSLLGCLIWGIVFGAIVYVTALPFKALFRPLWLTAGLPLLVLMLYIYFYPSQDPWAQWGYVAPSLTGVIHGANAAMRLLYVMMTCNVFVMLTTPLELTQALSVLTFPLCRIGVSGDKLFKRLTLLVRYFPMYTQELARIRRAQALRSGSGIKLSFSEAQAEAVNLFSTARRGAVRRCEELSDCMPVKGFMPEKECVRSAVKRPGLLDLSALTVSLGLLGLEIVVLGTDAYIF